MPQAPKKIQSIEGLRGAAAMGVVLCHVVGQFYGITRYSPGPERLMGWAGQVGVAVFFVISGFCIRLPMARVRTRNPSARLNAPEYLRHRALRILPAYWVAIGLSIIAGLVVPIGLLDGDHRPLSIVLHAAGLHTLEPSTLNSINGVFWTIGLEVQFYVAYLLLANRRASPSTGAALFGLALAVYAAASFTFPTGNPWRTIGQVSMPAMLWQWYLGAILADAYERYQPRVRPGAWPAIALMGGRLSAVALCLALGMVDPVVARIHLTYWALPFAAALLLASFVIRQEGAGPSLLAQAFGFLGRISYSMYLLHGLAIAFAVVVTHRLQLPALASALLAMAAAIVIAWASFEAVERPFMARPRRPSYAKGAATQTVTAP